MDYSSSVIGIYSCCFFWETGKDPLLKIQDSVFRFCFTELLCPYCSRSFYPFSGRSKFYIWIPGQVFYAFIAFPVFRTILSPNFQRQGKVVEMDRTCLLYSWFILHQQFPWIKILHLIQCTWWKTKYTFPMPEDNSFLVIITVFEGVKNIKTILPQLFNPSKQVKLTNV